MHGCVPIVQHCFVPSSDSHLRCVLCLLYVMLYLYVFFILSSIPQVVLNGLFLFMRT